MFQSSAKNWLFALLFFCSDTPARKEWPKAKEVMQHRRPTFEEEGQTTNKKFDLRDGKVEVWLFVASALFGAVFSLMLFQLVRLLRLHMYKPNADSESCHRNPHKAIERVVSEGIKNVVQTKKVVVMNIHLIPCDGEDCKNVQARGMVITKSGSDHNHTSTTCPKELYRKDHVFNV